MIRALAAPGLVAAVLCGLPLAAGGESAARVAADSLPVASDVTTAGKDPASPAGAHAFSPPPMATAAAGPRTPWEAIADDPVGRALRATWSLPAAGLTERVERTLRTGLPMGFRDLEGPARALLFASDEGTALERAEAAVRLAPDLPAARAARAHALLVEARDPAAAVMELGRALRATAAHPEGWLWARAVGLHLLAVIAVTSGLLFLVVAAGGVVPVLGRHLLGRVHALPPASRFAGVTALLLAPAALGEGLLGIALMLTGLGFVYGSAGRRLAVGLAAALLVAGLHPLADAAARARSAVIADPVALAASATERGLPSADELARVVRHAEDDPLAARALALRARREGRLEQARALYAPLLEAGEPSARLLNNAANVELALDHQDRAIALYEEAAAVGAEPAILFNLSQAYGRAVRLDAQDLALAQAQELDAAEVGALADLFSAYSPRAVVDLPLRVEALGGRLVEPAAARLMAESFRRRIAPARAQGPLRETAGALAIAALVGLLVGLVLRRLAGEPPDDHYADLAQLLQRRGTDPGERMRRLQALRARQARVRRLQLALAAIVPGAAGLLARRPLLALASVLCFVGAAVLGIAGTDLLAEPMALGALVPFAEALAAGVLGLAYLVQLGVAFSLREEA